MLLLPLFAPPPEVLEPVAIVGARVEHASGVVDVKTTIVLRDGYIAALGPEVPVPPHARVIDGTGLTVYPGFIDAAANAPLSVPETNPDQDVVPDTTEFAPPFMREANRRGIRPELNAALAYAPTPASLIADRKAGFTSLHLVPTGGILSGTTALVELGSRARRDSVVQSLTGLATAFRRPAGTGYPASLLGVHAQLRQTMLDGMQGRPHPADSTLAALYGKDRMYFEVDSENEIRRALDAGREFMKKVVIVGGQEAYRNVSALQGVPIIAGVAFGPEPRFPSDAPEPVRQDRMARYNERVANLAVLDRAGIRFALTTRGTRDRAEFWRNLRRAVNAGLSRQTALRALTAEAADILGNSDLGVISTGRRANLTITKGDFLAPDVVVRYVIVGGEVFRPDKDRLPAVAEPTVPDDDHDYHDDDVCEPQVKRGGGR